MGTFKDFFDRVEPIRVKEPLAETLGAFNTDNAVIEYSITDAIKMAGHICPTVASAYVCCQKAFTTLYPDEIPVRGEVAITVYGEPDEGVYGVMGQVFSFITGAAPLTGFRGLGRKFRRKDLLKFDSHKIDKEAMCFEFKRLDNDKSVLVKFYPQRVPVSEETAERLPELMEKVLWESTSRKETQEFHELWLEKVKMILLEQKDINNWLNVEAVGQGL